MTIFATLYLKEYKLKTIMKVSEPQSLKRLGKVKGVEGFKTGRIRAPCR